MPSIFVGNEIPRRPYNIERLPARQMPRLIEIPNDSELSLYLVLKTFLWFFLEDFEIFSALSRSPPEVSTD